MHVQVPVNTTATIYVPTADPEKVELYAAANDAEDTLEPLDKETVLRDKLTHQPVAAAAGYLGVSVGSGAYRFLAK
jgi:hypothetical protein